MPAQQRGAVDIDGKRRVTVDLDAQGVIDAVCLEAPALRLFQDGGIPGVAELAGELVQADVTQREDIAICESVQVGLRSAAYDRGRYAPALEMGDHHFHRLLHRDLKRAVG